MGGKKRKKRKIEQGHILQISFVKVTCLETKILSNKTGFPNLVNDEKS